MGRPGSAGATRIYAVHGQELSGVRGYVRIAGDKGLMGLDGSRAVSARFTGCIGFTGFRARVLFVGIGVHSFYGVYGLSGLQGLQGLGLGLMGMGVSGGLGPLQA